MGMTLLEAPVTSCFLMVPPGFLALNTRITVRILTETATVNIAPNVNLSEGAGGFAGLGNEG